MSWLGLSLVTQVKLIMSGELDGYSTPVRCHQRCVPWRMFGLSVGGDTSRNVTGIESSDPVPIVDGVGGWGVSLPLVPFVGGGGVCFRGSRERSRAFEVKRFGASVSKATPPLRLFFLEGSYWWGQFNDCWILVWTRHLRPCQIYALDLGEMLQESWEISHFETGAGGV